MSPNGESTGKGVSCYCFLEEEKGKYIFVKRSDESRWAPGKWIIPGGKPSVGERLEDTVKREVLEETGQKVVGLNVIGTTTFYVKHKDIHVVSLIYQAKAKGKVVLDQENVSYIIIPLSKAKKLDLAPGFSEALTYFIKMKKNKS
jgi:ADP-ribose pyrophosphatase YjhB (NUDIX family)